MARLLCLDTVRGFALGGILLLNAPAILHLGYEAPAHGIAPVWEWLQVVAHQRFFPVFSLLFGVGFGLMWLSASRRCSRPRVALARRFGFLALLGAAHQVLQPGEALLPYAIAATLFLLPATFLPPRRLAPVGAAIGAFLLVAGVVAGGGLAVIPGLFLLGFACAIAGWPARAEEQVRFGAVMAGLGASASAATLVPLLSTPFVERDPMVDSAAGLAMATLYVGLVLLALHTPLRGVLGGALAPLGRMALTNYIAATLVVLAIRAASNGYWQTATGNEPYLRILAISAVLLIAQCLISRWWLARFGQGPLERLWRYVTWGRSPRRLNPAPATS